MMDGGLDPTADGQLAVSVRAVRKEFAVKGGPAVPALDGVDLAARRGKVTGLVGADGAGKTTLLRLAAGLLVPTAGQVTVLGLDTVRDPLAIQSRLGYMPQQFGLYEDLSVRENLELYADLRGIARAERPDRFARLMRMTGLAPFMARRAGRLSGGMKQKLGLACCLVKSPELLLLDEPTVGVDPVSRRELWKIVFELVERDGIGVLISTSYLDEADRCDHVVVLHHGRRLAEGPPAEFHRRVRGRTFAVGPDANHNARRLQAHLMAADHVVDSTIHSGDVRLVTDGADQSWVAAALPRGSGSEVRPVEPCFEDAFMVLAQQAGHAHPAPGLATTDVAHPGNGQPVVRVRELWKRFGDFEAVRGISFEVRRGEVYGLLGPNGAGKSTTFRMLCGLLTASGGELSVAGNDLRRSGPRARARLGYMAQKFSLYGQLTVTQNLRFFGRVYGLFGRRLRERIDWALGAFELDERRNDSAEGLPRGYQQRLAMAAALLHEPDILFLDEPTSGADPLARREFWLRIGGFAEQGVTVIVTTHFMEEAEYCDRLMIMSAGQALAQGAPAAIRQLAQTDDNPHPTVEDAFVALAEGRVTASAENGGPHD